jgi:tetratricopeptide (TPR) repeat protein
MNPYYTIALVGFLVVLAVFLVKFVNRTVDEQFRGLARAADDAAFREQRIAQLSERLGRVLPLPEDVAPLPAPGAGWRGGVPPVLTALGVVLLWGGGGGAAREHRSLWLYGGLAALGVAAVIMLTTLRRRKWARTARMLLFRADLRRMGGDRIGAAEDLRQLLLLTPWDDAAWAELSDDLAVSGELPTALAAMAQASSIDPAYDEYHMLQASLAIRLKDFPRARAAIDGWRRAGGVDAEDPRVVVYRAALELAEGNQAAARAALAEAFAGDAGDDGDWDFLDDDQALAGVKTILPGRAGTE